MAHSFPTRRSSDLAAATELLARQLDEAERLKTEAGRKELAALAALYY